jgi:hypothetical protein
MNENLEQLESVDHSILQQVSCPQTIAIFFWKEVYN